MQIGNASQAPFSPASQQATPVDRQIDKLEQRKQALERDMRAPSSNPDPLAARGENDANRNFNRAEIEKLEAQIANLRNRQSEQAQTREKRGTEPRTAAGDGMSALGRYVDEFV